MCGYCNEAIALVAATRAAAPLSATRPAFVPVLALQESPGIAASLTHQPASPQGTTPFALVLLLRLSEILFRHGFDAPEVSALRRMPDFETLVDIGCRPADAGDGDSNHAPLDTRPFDWLFERDTYLQPGAFANHLPPAHAAIRLIKQYERWWLDGQGMNRVHLDDGDQLADATPADFARLQRGSVPLALAIAIAAQEPAGLEAIWALVKKCPLHIPGLHAFDLYLQRRAARAVLEHAGIARFATAFYSLRPALFQYLSLSGRINAEDRARLRARLIPMGDDSSDFSRWRWLVDGDLEQGLPRVP